MGFHISQGHPLRTFFADLVHRHLHAGSPSDYRPLAVYVSGVLVDFVSSENLYRIRNASGKRLQEVGEMLIESNPLLEGRSFDRERLVRKHIGDYTLFLTGLFPEYVAALRSNRYRLDAFVDYMKAGKESYGVVAAFDQGEYRGEAALFRRLASHFELCVFGLNQVKAELEKMQNRYYENAKRLLTSE